MFSVSDEEINYLVGKEKINALKHGKFHSDHEFWAVLKEELEEANDDMEACNNLLNCMWKKIKRDEEITNVELSIITMNAKNCVKELLQVMAVIDKYLDNVEGE